MLEMRGDPSRGRKRFLAVAAVMLSMAVAFLLAEVIVRLTFRYNTPETVKAGSLQYIPTIFAQHRLKPNQDVNTLDGWGERKEEDWEGLRFRVNNQGYRGTQIAMPKDAGTCRIVILGGSAVFGLKASEENTWPSLVESYFRERGHDEIEVINGGVPGHASFDSLGRLYSQAWMFEPDIVLVYNVWNDIKYIRYIDGIGPVTPLLSIVRPYDDTANPFMNYRNSFDKLLSMSQIYVKLRVRYYQWKLRPKLEGTSPRTVDRADAAPGRLGLRQFRLNYELIVDAARNIGAVPVLLTQATLVTPDTPGEDRQRIGYDYQQMDHETLAATFEDFNNVIRSVARDKEAYSLDLDEELSGRPDLFMDHVHLTEKGRMEISRRVGPFLEKVMNESNRCDFDGAHSAADGLR